MLYQQIASNKRKTILVMTFFIALFGLIGAAIGYVYMSSMATGIIVALVVCGIYMFITMMQSTAIVMGMNNAQEITDASQAPEIWHIVEDMAMVGRVPMPRVFIIDDQSPNAFATGPNPENAAVAVTRGLMERLNREEIEGVIAHEISHIRNYDIRLQTTALALSSAIVFLANLGSHAMWWGPRRDDDDREGNGVLDLVMMVLSILAIVLGPLAASLAQMALSRNREYLVDASAVELTRNPQGLISALEKITNSEPMHEADASSASLYIANPFKDRSWTHLFDTHPSTEKRIERLRKM